MQINRQVEKKENARVLITGSIAWGDLETFRERALKDLQATTALDGFREGTAPLAVIQKHVGDMKVLEEMAQHALSDIYPTLLAEEKIEAIGRPQITVKKLAQGNDFEFSIETDIMPSITLPDYQAIAKKVFKDPITVTASDEDVDKALKEIRQMRAHHKMHEENVPHESHNHKDIPDDQLPPLDDAFAQSIGNFKTLDELKTKVKENLREERERAERDKRRGELLDTIAKEAIIELPSILVDAELDKMISQFSHDIAMSGSKLDDYLKRVQKSLDDLKIEWRGQAEQRAKIQLAIDHIGEAEKITPSEDDIKKESDKIMEMYKDQKDVTPDRVRSYVTQVLTNAQVIEFLENKGK